VVSQGKSGHSKQSLTPFLQAQVATLQKGFSLGSQPTGWLGQVPFVILGHFSQAIPHTPIFMQDPLPRFSLIYRAVRKRTHRKPF
jgi:hypothetical protein